MRLLAATIVLALPAFADWTYFKSGPLEVWSDGDDDNAARRTLAVFDQVRWWTARTLGKSEITPMWPVRIVVMKKPGTARTPRIELRRDSYMAAMAAADAVSGQWIIDFVQILLHDDSRPMPDYISNSIARVLSTIEVKAARTTIGKPIDRPDRDWARMHLFMVDPNYAGRSRPFFSNMQQGAPIDICYRNAFERTEKEIEIEVDSYFKAGRFEPQETSGKPLNPERDYRERTGDPIRARILLADLRKDQAAYRAILNEGIKNPDAFDGAGMYLEATQNGSENARAWVAYALAETDIDKAHKALRRAMELAPRWAEPHARYAERETAPERKVPIYKRATELDPHNLEYWQQLAQAQTDTKDFAAALHSWRMAERAASTDEQRAAIGKRRAEYEQQRFDMEAAERRRKEEERQRELAKLKEEALAKIREAELRANANDKPADPKQKVVEWWDGPKPASTTQGTLERIECARSGPAKWIVKGPDGKLKTFVVPDPSKVAILGASEVTFGCGPQRPARRVQIDAGPNNEVMSVEFK